MDAWMVSDEGGKVPLHGSCSIGRGKDNTVVLAGEQVSRRHALLHQQGDGRYWLLDFGSANGTLLNSHPVRAPIELRHEDRIEIAGHFLTFRQDGRGAVSTGDESTRLASHLKTERLTESFAPTGHGLIVLDAHGKLESASAKAAGWLTHYFPEHKSPATLPPKVGKWLAAHVPASGKKAGVSEAFTIEHDGRRLRIATDSDPSGRLLLLLAEEELVFSPSVLQRIGLTPREAEVVHWIAEGKSNPEIAIILGIKPRTVTTHVESIFAKLGVNNRSTALLCVVEKLRGA